MRAMTRDQWEALWAELHQHRGLPLNEYAAKVAAIQARWRRDHPGFSFSNGRYVVHLEQALRKGAAVTDAMIADIDPDELRFDPWAFPLLSAAMGLPRVKIGGAP